MFKLVIGMLVFVGILWLLGILRLVGILGLIGIFGLGDFSLLVLVFELSHIFANSNSSSLMDSLEVSTSSA